MIEPGLPTRQSVAFGASVREWRSVVPEGRWRMATETAAEEYLAAARGLAPRIRELAPVIDAEARLPADLVEEMRRAGLFHLVIRREIGGVGLDPVSAARVVEEVSAADGSTGWCVMIAAQTGFFAGLLARDEARLVYGDGGIVAGVANPIGRAIPAGAPEEGYVVTGRWPFASGSSHATWFAGECTVYDGDAPLRDAKGNEVLRLAFVPSEHVTVHQTWNTLGLRGTASNDFSIDGVFVPAARAVSMEEPPPPLSRAMPLAFVNHGSQALGIARGAIESAAAIAAKKRGWGGVPLSETSRVQAAIGEAAVLVDAAAEHLYAVSGRLWEQALAGETDARLRAQVRLATSNAAQASVRAVDLLHSVVGTAGIFVENPMERQFRDIHTATKHVMIGHMSYEAAGRVLLGKDAAFPYF